MRVAIIQFPGSNADWDAFQALKFTMGWQPEYVFHKESRLNHPDLVVIPGGFSYGDYLRAGAIAGFSPIANAIREYAAQGGPVLGICNGFQILTEMKLLPGALTRNAHLTFECRDVFVRSQGNGAFTHGLTPGRVLRLPIAHAEGRYVCDATTLSELKAHDQIAFQYCDAQGQVESPCRVNGSIEAIAGIYNRQKNVLGLMPHPERSSDMLLGNADGKHLFTSFATWFARGGQHAA